eukprot:8784805-Pyramimonas_sp.AAC.1
MRPLIQRASLRKCPRSLSACANLLDEIARGAKGGQRFTSNTEKVNEVPSPSLNITPRQAGTTLNYFAEHGEPLGPPRPVNNPLLSIDRWGPRDYLGRGVLLLAHRGAL